MSICLSLFSDTQTPGLQPFYCSQQTEFKSRPALACECPLCVQAKCPAVPPSNMFTGALNCPGCTPCECAQDKQPLCPPCHCHEVKACEPCDLGSGPAVSHHNTHAASPPSGGFVFALAPPSPTYPDSAFRAQNGQDKVHSCCDPRPYHSLSRVRCINFHVCSVQLQYIYETFFRRRPELRDRGVFVEFGAQDGEAGSNTYFFEKRYGHTCMIGVLVGVHGHTQ